MGGIHDRPRIVASPGSQGHSWGPCGAAFVRRPEGQRREPSASADTKGSRRAWREPRDRPRGWPRPDSTLIKDASRLPRGQKLDLGPQGWRRTLRLSQRAARGHPLPLGSGWDPALGHDGGTGAPSAASVSCVSSALCWPGPRV